MVLDRGWIAMTIIVGVIEKKMELCSFITKLGKKRGGTTMTTMMRVNKEKQNNAVSSSTFEGENKRKLVEIREFTKAY